MKKLLILLALTSTFAFIPYSEVAPKKASKKSGGRKKRRRKGKGSKGAIKNIFQAAARGNIEKLDEFIKAGKVNEKNKYGATALHRAAFKGADKAVTKLLEAGADVNDQSEKRMKMSKAKKDRPAKKTKIGGKTPLMLAVLKGRIEAVEALLASKDINLVLKDVKGKTALHIALLRSQTRKAPKKLKERLEKIIPMLEAKMKPSDVKGIRRVIKARSERKASKSK